MFHNYLSNSILQSSHNALLKVDSGTIVIILLMQDLLGALGNADKQLWLLVYNTTFQCKVASHFSLKERVFHFAEEHIQLQSLVITSLAQPTPKASGQQAAAKYMDATSGWWEKEADMVMKMPVRRGLLSLASRQLPPRPRTHPGQSEGCQLDVWWSFLSLAFMACICQDPVVWTPHIIRRHFKHFGFGYAHCIM